MSHSHEVGLVRAVFSRTLWSGVGAWRGSLVSLWPIIRRNECESKSYPRRELKKHGLSAPESSAETENGEPFVTF